MNDLERYLFDLEGYIVLRGVLSPSQVDELNRCIDRAGVPQLLDGTPYVHTGFPDIPGNDDPGQGPVDVYNGLLTDWGPEIRALVAHPILHSHLVELLGDSYRLDHCYGVFMRSEAGKDTPHSLHNGGTPFDPSQYYLVRDGRMFNGLVVVSWALTDVPAGSGGFCCIPGSHKSSYPMPPEVASIMDERHPVRHVPLNTGDVVIFTEALTHGALPWVAGGERRALLFKYCPGFMQWEEKSLGMFNRQGPGWSPRQRRVLDSAYVGGRPPVDQEQA